MVWATPNYLSPTDSHYLLGSRIMFAFELPIHCFGAYLILFKTPSKMKHVKYALLMLHLCTALLDFTFSALLVLTLTIPAMMGYTLGILSYPFGIPVVYQFYFISAVIPWLGASICGTFEDRYYRLVKNKNGSVLDSKFRTLMMLINYGYGFFHFLPVYLTSPEHSVGVQYYQEKYPFLDPFYYQHENLYVIQLDWKLSAIIISISLTFYVVQIFRYFIATVIHLYASKTSAVSKNTLAMQRKLFKAIFLQVTVPLLLIIIPVMFFVFTYTINISIPILNRVGITMIASHGMIATIVMIVVHEPYRRAALEKIFRKRAVVKNKISIISSNPSGASVQPQRTTGQKTFRGIIETKS